MAVESAPRPPRTARRLSPTALRDVTASVMTLMSLAAIIYLAVIRGDQAASGALISVTSAAVGWYLRGRVETPAT